jgi:hypothetical protein
MKVTGSSAHGTAGCAGASGATCRLTVSLGVNEKLKGSKLIALSASAGSAKVTTRTVAVGSVTVTLDAGQIEPVTVKLNGTGQTLLKRYNKLRVFLIASSGSSTVTSQTLTFSSKKKPKDNADNGAEAAPVD